MALLGSFSVFGFVASYARMAWKVANYNALRREAESLRTNYQSLQRKVNEKDRQLATLEIYAKEVSIAFGIKQMLEGPVGISAEGMDVPNFPQSVEDYRFLRTANYMALRGRPGRLLAAQSRPTIWPVIGRLVGPFGKRNDPFSDEGAREFHAGVDISAPWGAAVVATGDGIVVNAQPTSGGYGRLVIIEHGAGIQTYYAHLSRINVQVGEAVRRGEVIGAVGTTGRVTAPHLHYEVRDNGSPQNPYLYMTKEPLYQASAQKDLPF